MVGVAVNFKKYIRLFDLTKSIISKLAMEVKCAYMGVEGARMSLNYM